VASLYVTETGAEVGLRNERIVVRKGKVTLASERVDGLERLVLAGLVHVTAHAIRALLAHHVDVVWQNLGGRHLGRLVSTGGRNAALIRRQFERCAEPEFALALARAFVAGKLLNQRRLLERHRGERSPAMVAGIVQLRALGERVDSVTEVDVLRGLEGAGAAAYFGAFGDLLKVEGIEWRGRIRRPPNDPVNVLLSFGYTLLTHRLAGMIETAGLFPYIGVLHEARQGRPSLALDLIEEFRPVVVDALVVRTLNRRELRLSDFTRTQENADIEAEWARAQRGEDEAPDPSERTLELSREGSKRWFMAMERRLNERFDYPATGQSLTLSQILQAQVWRLARHFEGTSDYEPYVMPRSS